MFSIECKCTRCGEWVWVTLLGAVKKKIYTGLQIYTRLQACEDVQMSTYAHTMWACVCAYSGFVVVYMYIQHLLESCNRPTLVSKRPTLVSNRVILVSKRPILVSKRPTLAPPLRATYSHAYMSICLCTCVYVYVHVYTSMYMHARKLTLDPRP